MNELSEKLRYKFKDLSLLETALTHSSYANEKRNTGVQSNERLEFLGDSVLGAVTAEYLFCTYPDKPEGELTRMRAALVCEQSLVQVAKRLSLGEFLKLGHGEDMGGGRKRSSILADAVEAVIAAVYLDGGFEAAGDIIRRLILEGHGGGIFDYKTELQELVQKKSGSSIEYELTDSRGPDHDKTFFVDVYINGKIAGKGQGHTKKEAEQIAAKTAMESLER